MLYVQNLMWLCKVTFKYKDYINKNYLLEERIFKSYHGDSLDNLIWRIFIQQ